MNPSQVLKPNITEEMAKEIALRLYGVEVISMKQLVSFDDKNFHIMVSPKHNNPYLETIWPHGYTLKMTNAGKSSVKGHFDKLRQMSSAEFCRERYDASSFSEAVGSSSASKMKYFDAVHITNKHTKVSSSGHLTCNVYSIKYSERNKQGGKNSMHNIMMHQQKKGLRLPYPVRNLKGSTWTLQELPVTGGESKVEKAKTAICGVHMLTYIPGVPVGSVKYTKDVLHQWGKLLAKFHNGLEGYKCPIFEKKSIYWDLSHVPEIKNFMDGLSESEESLVQEVLENYPREIYESNSSVRTGLLHGDFNENNILVRLVEENNGVKKYTVDGILDLEDMHYGPYVWDIGTMLAYVMLYCEDLDPTDGIAHAIAGYLSLRSLNTEEMSLLKICAACRLSQSYVLGMYSHRLDPKNSYLLNAQSNKWLSLKTLWKTPDDKLLKKLEDIFLEYKNLDNLTENHINKC